MTGLAETLAALVRDEVARQLAELRRADADADADRFLTLAEAAAFASTSTRTIRRWISSGKLAAHGVGRLVRVRRTDVEALLAEGGRIRRQSRGLTPEELARRDFG